MLRPGTCAVTAVALAFVSLAGCSAATGPTEDIGSTSAAITTGTVLSRADEWVTAKLLYCQSPNGADDSIDPSCPGVCMRESNAQWDPYRSDCSGFISWAWGLPAPGRTTDEFAPEDTTVSYAINGSDLQPGDALNIPGDHIILFVSWQTPGSVGNFYEEPGCSATPDYAHAFSSSVTISGQSVYVDYEGMSFTAIRYTGLTTGDGGAVAAVDAGEELESGVGTPCTVTTTGESGECMETSACAALGGHVSTPGYCPGADDIQCCTATAHAESSSSSAATSTSSAAATSDTGSGAGTEATSDAVSDAGSPVASSPSASAPSTSQPEPPVGGSSNGASSRRALAPSLAVDAGHAGPSGPDASDGASGSSGGCSAGAASASPVGAGWLFGLFAVGLARRRRALRSAAQPS